MGLTANAGQTPQEMRGALNQNSLAVSVLGATPNLAAVGMETASLIYLTGVASISGIAGGYDGRELTLVSLDGNQTLVDASGLSTDVNRFLFGANVILSAAGSAAFLRWIAAPLGRWVLMGTASVPGGGAVPGAPVNSVQFNSAGAFGGDADFTWNATLNQERRNGMLIEPLQLAAVLGAGNNNNFTPATDADYLYLTPNAGGSNLTGLLMNTAQVAGQKVHIVNPDAAVDVVVVNQSAASTAANRFICPGGGDVNIIPGASITVRYETAPTARWRVQG